MSDFKLELLKMEAEYGYSKIVRITAIQGLSEWENDLGVIETTQRIAINCRNVAWKSALRMLVHYSNRNPSVSKFIEMKAKNFNYWDAVHWYFIAAAIYLKSDDDDLWNIVKNGIVA